MLSRQDYTYSFSYRALYCGPVQLSEGLGYASFFSVKSKNILRFVYGFRAELARDSDPEEQVLSHQHMPGPLSPISFWFQVHTVERGMQVSTSEVWYLLWNDNKSLN